MLKIEFFNITADTTNIKFGIKANYSKKITCNGMIMIVFSLFLEVYADFNQDTWVNFLKFNSLSTDKNKPSVPLKMVRPNQINKNEIPIFANLKDGNITVITNSEHAFVGDESIWISGVAIV